MVDIPLSDEAIRNLQQVSSRPDMAGTRYELRDRLGIGGMGTVYCAWDPDLQREVALKVLSLPEQTDALAERFVAEARILAHLEHPGIVPVHDVGRLADGRVFYTMQRVRGQRLDELVAGGAPRSRLLNVFVRVCEAVAFAHAAGVVHRDLKPDNVMVGSFGEALVMDWGVAKILPGSELKPLADPTEDAVDPRPGHTSPGTVLGTPGYMPPEQASGSIEFTDRRSDVYALGAVLFFLLTGRRPDPGQRGGPRKTDSTVSRRLDAICARAMNRAPDERYSSARELADDILRFQAQEKVTAYRESIPERLLRLAVKYRTALLLVVAYLIMRVLLILLT